MLAGKFITKQINSSDNFPTNRSNPLKMKKLICFLFLLSVTVISTFAQNDVKTKGLGAITPDAVKGQLEFLASDWTEGRATGEKGGFIAADYIMSMFKVYGIQPAGDMNSDEFTMRRRRRETTPVQPRTRSYFQDFELVDYSPGDEQLMSIISSDGTSKKSMTFNNRTDFTVRTGDVGFEIEAPVVFVGYGVVDKKNNYDDYKDMNVKGKIILRLSGFPGFKDTASVAYKKFKPENNYTFQNAKDKYAEENGAVAVIEYNPTGNLRRSWVSNYPLRYNTPTYEGDKPLNSNVSRMRIPGDTLNSSLVNLSVTSRCIVELLKGTGIDLARYDELVKTQMKPASKSLAGKSIFLKTTVKSRLIKARNVVGMIEGENPNEIVMIGGHYDHLGTVNGFIFNGADDNASGTVGVMTVAKAIAATGIKPKRTIIFAAWTGEEKGLLGSDYWVDYVGLDKKVVFYMNFDMIARNATTDSAGIKCGFTYTKAYKQLQEFTENNAKDYKIGLDIKYTGEERPTGGSDFTAFSIKNIPVIEVMAAMHPDYHQYTDEVSKVNFPKMTNIIRLGFLDIWDIANMPEKLVKE